MAYHIFYVEDYAGETICGLKLTGKEHYDRIFHKECKRCQAIQWVRKVISRGATK